VRRLLIQELVQGTFDEASDDHLRSNAVRQLIEDEILTMLQTRKRPCWSEWSPSSPLRLAAISNGRKTPQKQD
jgi:hypothetical protein